MVNKENLTVGMRVTINGLTTNTGKQYNNLYGIVKTISDERAQVYIYGKNKVVSFKFANLQPWRMKISNLKRSLANRRTLFKRGLLTRRNIENKYLGITKSEKQRNATEQKFINNAKKRFQNMIAGEKLEAIQKGATGKSVNLTKILQTGKSFSLLPSPETKKNNTNEKNISKWKNYYNKQMSEMNTSNSKKLVTFYKGIIEMFKPFSNKNFKKITAKNRNEMQKNMNKLEKFRENQAIPLDNFIQKTFPGLPTGEKSSAPKRNNPFVLKPPPSKPLVMANLLGV